MTFPQVTVRVDVGSEELGLFIPVRFGAGMKSGKLTDSGEDVERLDI
jgi:hypothetical protein